MEATFVLLDDVTGATTRYNPARASERFRPASTFKIPNTIIVLETGVASGPDFVVRWDSTLMTDGFFPRSWRGDQTLRSAFRNSVYWVYQELTRRVGEDRMRMWLNTFRYGDRAMGTEVDDFWLEGPLTISPDEQVAFLRKLRNGAFPVSDRSLAILDEISLLEERDGYSIHGKTGTSNVTATRENGWIVGWVEVDGRTSYWALNMEGESVWEDWPPQSRVDLVKEILMELEVLP